MDAVIRTQGLTKSYGANRGVEEVDLEVRGGEVFGFLGPNGAGKSTTIRTLIGLLRPTRGLVQVLGLDPFRDAARVHARVGYVPGEMGIAERLTAGEHLEFLANLRRTTGAPRLAHVAQRLDLDLSKPVRKMSRGNKQKVGLVQAFMSAPELLILDEPTTGLDPLMQQEFYALVREAQALGATVFLSSHILAEVEALCDRVAVIREGRIVTVETVQTLKERALRHVRVRFPRPIDAGRLADVPGTADVQANGNVVTCTLRGGAGPLVRRLAELDAEDVQLREASLDEVFQTYYAQGGPR